MQHYSATEIQTMVRNMDVSKETYKHLKDLSPQEYEGRVGAENEILCNDFYSIFKKHLNDELDETFFYMMDMRRKIENGEETEDTAAVVIGQKLAERWINPVVSNLPIPSAISYEDYYKNIQKK